MFWSKTVRELRERISSLEYATSGAGKTWADFYKLDANVKDLVDAAERERHAKEDCVCHQCHKTFPKVSAVRPK